jgi:hypothetical protein
MDDTVSKFSEALKVACDKSFKTARPHTKTKRYPGGQKTSNSKEAGTCTQKEMPKNKKQ